MAYSEYLADRIRQGLHSGATLVEKKMMGGLVFMVNDKMCIGLDKDKSSGEDRLMVRVGKARYERLLQMKGCREMNFTGKAMKGFVYVYPEGFDGEEQMVFWIKQALAFNQDLKK